MDVITELVLPETNESPNFEQGTVFFVGNATVIIRYAGFTILTDPNFLHKGDHIHVGYGLKGVRLKDPAIELDELPPIDLVILSHMHEDHFDRLVEKKLNKTTPIVTTPQAAKTLEKKGFLKVYSLKTWQTFYLAKGDAVAHITALPARHGPGPLAYLLPQVMGSLLEFQPKSGHTEYSIYISGDTLAIKDLQKIHQRFPDVNLGLIHLGGTTFYGLMLTMDAQQGVQAIRMVQPDTVIPVHFDDYNMFKSSLDDFARAFLASGLNTHIEYLKHGDIYTFARVTSTV